MQSKSILLIFAACFVHSVAADSSGRFGLEDVETVETLEARAEKRIDWSLFSAHDETSTVEVDASAYDDVFKTFGDRTDSAALDYLYLSRRGIGQVSSLSFALQKMPVSKLNRDEQLAYWLNLHNAQAILTTARHYPLHEESTRSVILSEPWSELSMTVEEQRLSLRDIEVRIVLRQWPEQEVLYGFHFPAVGTPPGPTTAFTGKNVRRRLLERAEAYVNGEHAMQFVRDELHVSALYLLSPELFPDDKSVIGHLVRHASPTLQKELKGFDKITALWLNWRLNSFNSGYDVSQDRAGGGS